MSAKIAGVHVDFGATGPVFEPTALLDRSGMRRAARTLAKVRELDHIDPRWAERVAELFALPFPENHQHEADRHELFSEAALLLLRIGDGKIVPRLVETLGGIAEGPSRQHKFVIDLVGRLGRSGDLPALLRWFNRQNVRTISSGSAFAAYAVMVNTLVRLGTPETVRLIKKQLALADREELTLNQHERFMFEKALEMIAAGEPPKYGFTFLPADAG